MTSIRYDVPYFFEATYVPKGKRKPIEGKFGGLISVFVESVSSAQAPCVLTVEGKDGFRRNFRSEYAAFDGAIFEKEREKDDGLRLVDDFSPSWLRVHSSSDLHSFAAGEISEKPDGDFCSIEGEYREDAGLAAVERKKDEVRRAAEGLLFVDGELFRRAELPKLRTEVDYRISGSDVITITLMDKEDSAPHHGMVFSLADMASAQDWATERCRRERDDTRIDNKLDVQVLAPHLLPQDDTLSREVLRIANSLVQEDIKFKDQPRSVIETWLDARDALHAAQSSENDGDINHMLDTVDLFYRSYVRAEDERCRKFGSSHLLSDDIAYHRFAGAKSVWENRPVYDLEEALALSHPKALSP